MSAVQDLRFDADLRTYIAVALPYLHVKYREYIGSYTVDYSVQFICQATLKLARFEVRIP